MNKGITIENIISWIKTVYDPEFPMVDIYTLGLIYNVKVNNKEKKIHIIMTFTTPACPMADMLEEMVKNSIWEHVPQYEIDIEISFEPMRNFEMIRDKDLKRMFE